MQKTNVMVVDIDGTIALRGDRGPHDHDQAMEDAVNYPVIYTVEALRHVQNWSVLLVSGRDEKYRSITEYWLYRHQLLRDRIGLYMRARGDQRPDQEVKREIYQKFIEPHYVVKVIFDDRQKVVDMWRELGLTCFQVAEGNY